MDAIVLTNAEFPFELGGKIYQIKKANLQQVILFQRRQKELAATQDAGSDMLLAAYAIFLVVNAVDKNVTEEHVLEQTPGNLEILTLLAQLGFINQQKVDAMIRVRDALVKPIGAASTQ